MEQQRVVTNGITLNVAQAGPADGPLLILLHGFPEFWWGWRRQIDFLAARGFRVWAPDQRGYNLSDKPAGIDQYRVDVLAQDIVGLLDVAGERKVGIVGHDWGGSVAWRIASRFPERISRVAILNAPHGEVMLRHLRTDVAQMRRSWYIFVFQLPWLPEFVARLGNWWLVARAMTGSSRPGTFSAADLAEYRRAWSRPGAYTAMVNWYRAALHFSGAGDASVVGGRPSAVDDASVVSGRRAAGREVSAPGQRVVVPTLLIWGTNDDFLKTGLAAESIALCDDGRLEYIDGASHWVLHEEPDRVNELLGDFFSELRRG